LRQLIDSGSEDGKKAVRPSNDQARARSREKEILRESDRTMSLREDLSLKKADPNATPDQQEQTAPSHDFHADERRLPPWSCAKTQGGSEATVLKQAFSIADYIGLTPGAWVWGDGGRPNILRYAHGSSPGPDSKDLDFEDADVPIDADFQSTHQISKQQPQELNFVNARYRNAMVVLRNFGIYRRVAVKKAGGEDRNSKASQPLQLRLTFEAWDATEVEGLHLKGANPGQENFPGPRWAENGRNFGKKPYFTFELDVDLPRPMEQGDDPSKREGNSDKQFIRSVSYDGIA
jgi:hypothetical protein